MPFILPDAHRTMDRSDKGTPSAGLVAGHGPSQVAREPLLPALQERGARSPSYHISATDAQSRPRRQWPQSQRASSAARQRDGDAAAFTTDPTTRGPCMLLLIEPAGWHLEAGLDEGWHGAGRLLLEPLHKVRVRVRVREAPAMGRLLVVARWVGTTATPATLRPSMLLFRCSGRLS